MKRVVSHSEEGFEREAERLARRGLADTASAEAAVRAILDDVAARGDDALVEYTEHPSCS